MDRLEAYCVVSVKLDVLLSCVRIGGGGPVGMMIASDAVNTVGASRFFTKVFAPILACGLAKGAAFDT